MSHDWPPTGASVLLDLSSAKAGQFTDLTTRVLATTGTGLLVLPPLIDRAVRGDLSGCQAFIRWSDPDHGPSVLAAEIGRIDRCDRSDPWLVHPIGTPVRHQRRRFVREQVPGTTCVCQSAAVVVPAPRGTHDPVRGRMLDLGEGGVRLRTTQAPSLDFAAAVQAQVEPEGGAPLIVPQSRILRVEWADQAWQIVLEFPEDYPVRNQIRSLVFAAMRVRVRAAQAIAGTVPA